MLEPVEFQFILLNLAIGSLINMQGFYIYFKTRKFRITSEFRLRREF